MKDSVKWDCHTTKMSEPIMPRTMLSDESWERLAKLMKGTGRVYNKREHRLTLERIFFRMRTGCPWRDLPREFGH